MRLKIGIWAIAALALFGALLEAAPPALKAAHLHWPAWPLALGAAIIAALSGLARPVTAVITQSWAKRTRRQIQRQGKARQIERDVGGRNKGLPQAGQITDRALLGIHPSIPLPADADASLPPDLPLYIPRDIDADLRAWITAHRQSGGLLLLVGPAAAGKTRSAYELAREMLADWPMFMPSTPAQLTDYIHASPSPGKLIIWLNETQNFLGPDGLTTATVRRILASPRPAIIIGTIWPQHYDTLTTPPDTATSGTSQDAREILTMLADRKDLHPGFSDAEHRRGQSLAARDPRIAEAMNRTDSPNIAETLAAAPDLISRWLTAADAGGAAVITAAITARRCGHPEPLPGSILQPLAETILTPAQRARAQPGWFQPALNWARTPVRGLAAPLTPQAITPGTIDGDHISDVLVQHADRDPDAPGHTITEHTWLLLINHATPGACKQIADTAHSSRHTHHSAITERAIRKAADTGDPTAMSNLGTLLEERGDAGQAEQWYRKAANAGDPTAMTNLGTLLEERGDAGQAEQWYRKAANAGQPTAMTNLGALLREQGETGQAEQWYRKAANAGHLPAMTNLGVLLHKQGDAGQAEQWYRKAADAGQPEAMYNLGVLLSEQGDTDQAEQWYRKAADAGQPEAMYNLGVLLHKQGETDQAEQWYRKAADAGQPENPV
jgi:Flp pilus assembly protein TadD